VRRNLELKARCNDIDAARDAARSAGALHQGLLIQTDTYFHCPNGRLKLRHIEPDKAELIWYSRPDSPQIRGSDYILTPIPDPASALAALSTALGVRGIIHKRRELWLLDNLRIHLDEVDGLGQFIEFEAVISHDRNESAAPSQIRDLCLAMKIFEKDLVSGSYSDLAGF